MRSFRLKRQKWGKGRKWSMASGDDTDDWWKWIKCKMNPEEWGRGIANCIRNSVNGIWLTFIVDFVFIAKRDGGAFDYLRLQRWETAIGILLWTIMTMMKIMVMAATVDEMEMVAIHLSSPSSYCESMRSQFSCISSETNDVYVRLILCCSGGRYRYLNW